MHRTVRLAPASGFLVLVISVAGHAANVTLPGTYSSPYASQITVATGDTLSILAGGTATGTPTSVLASSTGIVSISNAGSINSGTASSSYGIQFQNATVTSGIVNSGTILSGRTAIGNVRGSATNMNTTIAGGITNNGVLRVTGFGNSAPSAIQFDNGSTITGGITNGAGAIIESIGTGDQNMGIAIGSSGAAPTTFAGGIDNAGLIRAPSLNAIRIYTTGTNGSSFSGGITNRTTGTISGPAGWGGLIVWGAVFNGNIDNSGFIEGPNGIILRLSSTCTGDLINRAGATIQGTIAGSVAVNFDNAVFNGAVTNAGTIDGGTAATNTGFRVGSVAVNQISGGLSNSGMIRGVTNSVSLLNPANAFTVANSGTLSGPAAIGINTLSLQGSAARVVGTTTGSATSVVNVSGTFTSEGTFNVGTLTIAPGGQMTMNANVAVGAGGLNNAGRLLVNSGSSVVVTTGSGGQFLTTGSLLVGGTLGGATAVIQSAGRLGGAGTISAATTIAGLHSPGSSPGVQTFGSNLTYEAGATVAWELFANTTGGTGNFDQIVLPTGNLTFSGSTALDLSFNGAGSAVDWSNSFWGVDRTWLLHDLSSGVTTGIGNFSIVGQNWLDSSGTALSAVRPGASFSVGLAGQDVVINYMAPVPEPVTYAMALAGLAGGGLSMWRRRKRA